MKTENRQMILDFIDSRIKLFQGFIAADKAMIRECKLRKTDYEYYKGSISVEELSIQSLQDLRESIIKLTEDSIDDKTV